MIPNIGPNGRRQRLTFGLIALGVSAAVLAVLIVSRTPRMWRLALFAPLFLAGIGVFQAQGKT